MKKFLFSLVSLAFVAASTNHQAFGPVHFGMNRLSTRKAEERLIMDLHTRGIIHYTAATARQNFVTTGKRYTARLEAHDASINIKLEMQCEPVLTEIGVASEKFPARDLDLMKAAWEVFQDIGDCKLPRVGAKGVFPAVEEVAPGREVVTDTWEGEGIRVQLLVRSLTDPVLPDPVYVAVLKATEISPSVAK